MRVFLILAFCLIGFLTRERTGLFGSGPQLSEAEEARASIRELSMQLETQQRILKVAQSQIQNSSVTRCGRTVQIPVSPQCIKFAADSAAKVRDLELKLQRAKIDEKRAAMEERKKKMAEIAARNSKT